MDRIYPVDLLRLLDRLGVGDVDYDGFTIRADEHAFERLTRIGVDLLMRHVGRYEEEVAGTGLRDELKSLAPPLSRMRPARC